MKCNKCVHSKVCGYKDRYAAMDAMVGQMFKNDDSNVFSVEIRCKFYNEQSLSFGTNVRDAGNPMKGAETAPIVVGSENVTLPKLIKTSDGDVIESIFTQEVYEKVQKMREKIDRDMLGPLQYLDVNKNILIGKGLNKLD